jgi:hypothetical protein
MKECWRNLLIKNDDQDQLLILSMASTSTLTTTGPIAAITTLYCASESSCLCREDRSIDFVGNDSLLFPSRVL